MRHSQCTATKRVVSSLLLTSSPFKVCRGGPLVAAPRLKPASHQYPLGLHSMDASLPGTAHASSKTDPAPDPLTQYVVLRSDLWTQLKWPLGSVVAQACHACSASQWLFREDPHTQQYMEDLDNMRKVVLEVKSEAALTALSEQLAASGILHKLWIEQPENVPTCLAIKPYPKSIVGPSVKKLPLCRTPLGKS